MSKTIIRKLNLQLFADGGDGGTGGADGASGVDVGASLPATNQTGVKNPLADVKYGKQTQDDVSDAGIQKTEPLDLNAEFEELIKGKYKSQYDSRVQDTVQKRFKSTKETVDKYNALTPTLEMLAQKYGVKDASDIKAIQKAIEEDDAYYEDEAIEKGMSVEQLKAVKKMERENAELKRQIEEQSNRENVEREVAGWMQQAQEAKKVFPNLDLKQELDNPEFVGLLRSGVSLETAYFAIHHDQLVPQAMRFSAKEAEQKIVNKVISNGIRPSENALNSQSASKIKSDVSQLTKADRDEIDRRVARGEKISF